MYSSGKKAILMTNDGHLKRRMHDYFMLRYNLLLESTPDALDVLERIDSDDDGYELAILDENLVGLATTSHVLKNIKDRGMNPNVLYLSTLQEVVNPSFQNEMKFLPEYSDENYRDVQAQTTLQKMMSICDPIIESISVRELMLNCCQDLVNFLGVDSALAVLARFDQNPVYLGSVVAHYPDLLAESTAFRLRGGQYFNDLLDYLKPIHIPDLNTDIAFCKELNERFSVLARAVLIVPMALGDKLIGYLAAFRHSTPRCFNLTEIDRCLRLADFAAASVVDIYHASVLKIKHSMDS